MYDSTNTLYAFTSLELWLKEEQRWVRRNDGWEDWIGWGRVLFKFSVLPLLGGDVHVN